MRRLKSKRCSVSQTGQKLECWETLANDCPKKTNRDVFGSDCFKPEKRKGKKKRR